MSWVGATRLARADVAEIQRERLLAAAVEAVDEVGCAGMSVAQVIGRAGVSRKTFYGVFTDREGEAYRSESTYRDGVRAGLARLLGSWPRSSMADATPTTCGTSRRR